MGRVSFCLLLVIPLSLLVHGDDSLKNTVSSTSTLSSANGFRVSYLSETNLNGLCVSILTILGNGINKMIDYPCNSKPQSIINLNRTLLVGDEYFSDTPSVLVRIVDGSCSKEVFYENDGKFTSTVVPMVEKDCDTVKIKIVILKEQQDKWTEWYKNKQEETFMQLQQLQNSLATLQHNLFGGIFGGGFFG